MMPAGHHSDSDSTLLPLPKSTITWFGGIFARLPPLAAGLSSLCEPTTSRLSRPISREVRLFSSPGEVGLVCTSSNVDGLVIYYANCTSSFARGACDLLWSNYTWDRNYK